MIGSKRGIASGLGLFLLLLFGCAPERDLPLEADAPRRSSAESAAPRLESVEPSRALFSSPVTVTLRGTGFGSNITSVSIGRVTASQITQVSGSTVTAVFEGTTSSARVGLHSVAVHFGNGKSATLADAFRWDYDQDPVVFVHGCPLPKETLADSVSRSLGSVTNYITSKIWHQLYRQLQEGGYPGPVWEQEDHFLSHPGLEEVPRYASFDHPATHPAPDNYLNVFVLSEDDRDPAHQETAPPSTGAGHCGSGLHLAYELDRFVDRVLAATGVSRVDLVVNSAGALGARWFLGSPDYRGTKKVRDIVFLAPMNHGTQIALAPTAYDQRPTWWSPNYEAAREGYPAHACEGQGRGGLEASSPTPDGRDGRDLQYLVNGCFSEPGRIGNGSVEVPEEHGGGADGVAYLVVYNALADELIEPTSSACLNQEFPGDCDDTNINVPVHAQGGGEGPHGAIRKDPEVLDLTVCYLRRRSPEQTSPKGNCQVERDSASIYQ